MLSSSPFGFGQGHDDSGTGLDDLEAQLGLSADDGATVSLDDLKEQTQAALATAEQLQTAGNERQADVVRVRLCIRLQRILHRRAGSTPERIRQFVDRVCRKFLPAVSPSSITDASADAPGDAATGGDDSPVAVGEGESDDDVDIERLVSRRRRPQRSLDDLKGQSVMESLRDTLERIELFHERTDLSIRQHANLMNLLFYGPPGTGKSHAAEAVANHLNESLGFDFQYVPIDGGVIKHHHFGKSQKRLEGLLRWADRTGPTVVFIDEMEEIASKEAQESSASITNSLLALTDGANAVEDVVVIGATNRRDLVEPAILSRFRSIEFPVPDEEARRQILRHFLSSEEEFHVPIDPRQLAQLDTEGLAGRDLREVVAWAAVNANDGSRRPIHITLDDLRAGLATHRRHSTDDRP